MINAFKFKKVLKINRIIMSVAILVIALNSDLKIALYVGVSSVLFSFIFYLFVFLKTLYVLRRKALSTDIFNIKEIVHHYLITSKEIDERYSNDYKKLLEDLNR